MSELRNPPKMSCAMDSQQPEQCYNDRILLQTAVMECPALEFDRAVTNVESANVLKSCDGRCAGSRSKGNGSSKSPEYRTVRWV
ncbi:hypothetical protein BASA84_001287 [Batrachochytrium salamandrivorans]|nr:hypothetical protein BASA84_001287 [Batrachochytrium salamandrivorans]